jgi:hypothetical protein
MFIVTSFVGIWTVFELVDYEKVESIPEEILIYSSTRPELSENADLIIIIFTR